ncbi:hypothetical protein AAFN86_28880 [Roseomonas sp. CAU 1739]|uniref:hypothetical protein n=1 Tax=Roseomonas sp. CAU 1739 TaxID=3140364 RepID=UPI00325A7853
MTPETAAGHLIITGTRSGIGAAIATRLLSEGWRVTSLSRAGPGLADAHFVH